MDSKSTPALTKFGGTKISRRTVTRGVAWSVPVAAVAYTAPAYASSQPPVVAGQCGQACKHPGSGQNLKSYHFTFCFKVGSEAIDGNQVILDKITKSDGQSKDAYSGIGLGGVFNRNVTVSTSDTSCVYVDAEQFTNSPTTPVVLTFHYFIGGVRFDGCATAQVTGDVCGSSEGVKDQPKEYPHGALPGPGEAITECDPNPGDC